MQKLDTSEFKSPEAGIKIERFPSSLLKLGGYLVVPNIDLNTVYPEASQGNQGWINDERMVVHYRKSGCLGLDIPSNLKFPFALEMSLGNWRCMYNPINSSSLLCTDTIHPVSRQCTAILSLLIHSPFELDFETGTMVRLLSQKLNIP